MLNLKPVRLRIKSPTQPWRFLNDLRSHTIFQPLTYLTREGCLPVLEGLTLPLGCNFLDVTGSGCYLLDVTGSAFQSCLGDVLRHREATCSLLCLWRSAWAFWKAFLCFCQTRNAFQKFLTVLLRQGKVTNSLPMPQKACQNLLKGTSSFSGRATM